MSYCGSEDILEQISETELIELTDDEGTGEIVNAVVARAIADADAEIDSYCAGRYEVPFSPVPVMVRKLSVDIAIYNLFSRRSVLKVPEDRLRRYEMARQYLRDVSRGVVSLGADAPEVTGGDKPAASLCVDDRIFRLRVGGALDRF